MKLVDKLDLSRQKKEQDKRTQTYLESIRSQYIQELILGNHPGYGWEEDCVNVGLEWLLEGNLRLLLVSMERSGIQKDLERFKTAQFAVQNVMYEVISGFRAICPVRLSVGRWLLAVGEGTSDEWLMSFSGTLRDTIAQYTKHWVHVMISETGENVLDLGRLFWETEKTMEYMGEDPSQPIRCINPSQKELAYGEWSKPMHQLITWIAEGETDSIVNWLNELGTSFLSWDLESAQRWCFEWLFTLREHLQHNDTGSVGTARPDADGLRMRIASQYRNKELLQFFRQEVHRMIKRRHGKRPHQLIKKAIQFIEKNYNQDIHLATIAEELCMSPVYLSEFFKSQTGVTFRSYLLQVRMAEAIRLLKDPTVKVYEVSYQVGYGKVEHFVKLFKKQYGMTPSEYRGALV
jgi:AraC-like DNA-binding protein